MLVGKRLRFRAIEYEDLPLLIKWRNDPDIYKNFFEHEPISMAAQRRWFENLLQKPDEKLWIVETIENSEPIGTIGMVHIDWRNRKLELGRILIYPDEYRHGGYGSEIESIFLVYVFEHLNFNRVYCEVFAHNENAIAVHKKLGFKEEGIFRQHIYKDGKYKDIVYLGLLREEYFQTSKKAIREYLDM